MGISDKYVTKKLAKSNPMLKESDPIAPEWENDVMCASTNKEVKVTTGSLTILFKGIIERHINNRQYIKNGTVKTIEHRNSNNREPRL